MSLAERLKYARTYMNLKLTEVAERSEIAASALSDFENGKREPKLPQLMRMAEVYQRSTSFFLENGPVPVEMVLWRQKPESPKLEELQTQLLRLAEQYHHLEKWCEDLESVQLPFDSGDPTRYGYPQAERLAHRFRNEFGLGERPGPSLLNILEEVCKVKIFHVPFEPSGSAACTLHEQFGAAILLNSKNAPWRRTFDLAHELFHLLTWKIFRKSETGTVSDTSDQEEKLATCFARNLLMPQEPLRIACGHHSGDFRNVSFDDFFEIARQFDVSVEALIWQMTFVFNLDKGWAQAKIEHVKPRISYWEKRQHDDPPIRPVRFEALAFEALQNGFISTGRYAEYVGITRREAMRLFEQEALDDAKAEIAHS